MFPFWALTQLVTFFTTHGVNASTLPLNLIP